MRRTYTENNWGPSWTLATTLPQGHKDTFLYYYSSFTVLLFTCRPSTHLDCFQCMMWNRDARFVSAYVDIQLRQQHLLKIPPFPPPYCSGIFFIDQVPLYVRVCSVGLFDFVPVAHGLAYCSFIRSLDTECWCHDCFGYSRPFAFTNTLYLI